ncbi:unnamed protein product [Wuchereria bancrofti]|uniref:Uncharacterized protein n=1 Tax=Wuchereria bancrofti TaxID=6293 RepID=A0A3P7ELN2_WUCBA|nr:unnamed protein product [Wuchereria bancrofti]
MDNSHNSHNQLHPGEMQKLKMKSEIEVISKTRNKVGVQELKDGTKFRQKLISKLGRFGAQFFAPVTNEPSG